MLKIVFCLHNFTNKSIELPHFDQNIHFKIIFLIQKSKTQIITIADTLSYPNGRKFSYQKKCGLHSN